MPVVAIHEVVSCLRWAASAAGLTDGAQLDRFIGLRDQDAFADLVRRHGPMVIGAAI